MTEQEWIEKEKNNIRRDLREVQLKYAEHGIDLYKRYIDFNYNFVVFIGLIAGFGFTAIDSIQSSVLFILGELCLIIVAVLVLFHTRKIYKEESKSIFDSNDSRSCFFQKCLKCLEKEEENKISEDEYRRIKSDLAKPVFGSGQKQEFDPLPSWFIMMFFFAALLLLISFFASDFYKLLCIL